METVTLTALAALLAPFLAKAGETVAVEGVKLALEKRQDIKQGLTDLFKREEILALGLNKEKSQEDIVALETVHRELAEQIHNRIENSELLKMLRQVIKEQVENGSTIAINARSAVPTRARLNKTFKLLNTIPPPVGFIGRRDYLDELRKAYRTNGRCFVLHGIAGIGKTALALEFANEILADFKAKIFVDMQGMNRNSLSSRDAMLEVVRWFEPEIQSEISDSQLRGVFVQSVRSQPTLIVLDNAKNKDAVEPLKQANACFIITSRESFTLTDMRGGVKVSQMSSEDARCLLFEIANEERFEGRADELTELAGYMPMALKSLASILVEDAFESVSDLIEKYRDKQELLKIRVPDYENRTIEASFDLSYETLEDEIKGHWRKLSVFPSFFEESAISAVLNVPSDEARSIQKQLRSLNMLERNIETKRFYMHDLVRSYTGDLLSEKEYFEAKFDFATHYASVLKKAEDIQSHNGKNSFITALSLIDADWGNVLRGQFWAETFMSQRNDIGKLCIDYSNRARDLISLRLNPRENINWLKAALRAAHMLQDREAEGETLCNLGKAYFSLGDFLGANNYYQQSLKIMREICQRKKEGEILNELGHIHTNANLVENSLDESSGRRYIAAIDQYYMPSLEIAREVGNKKGESRALGSLGVAYYNFEDFQTAIRFHKQSLMISREIGDRKGEGDSLGNLGLAYSRLNRCKEGIDNYIRAIDIAKEIGYRKGESNGWGNLGNIYKQLGQYQDAIKYHKRSLSIKYSIGDRQGQGNSLGNLGNVYSVLHDNKMACQSWKEALLIFKEIGSPLSENLEKLIKENNCA